MVFKKKMKKVVVEVVKIILKTVNKIKNRIPLWYQCHIKTFIDQSLSIKTKIKMHWKYMRNSMKQARVWDDSNHCNFADFRAKDSFLSKNRKNLEKWAKINWREKF